MNITTFGAFINILPGRDGLLHISKVDAERRVDNVEDYLSLGDKVKVVVREIDRNGKVSLELAEPIEVSEEVANRPKGGGGGGDRGGRDRDRGGDRGGRGGDRGGRDRGGRGGDRGGRDRGGDRSGSDRGGSDRGGSDRGGSDRGGSRDSGADRGTSNDRDRGSDRGEKSTGDEASSPRRQIRSFEEDFESGNL